MLTVESPSKLRIPDLDGFTEDRLRTALTYTNNAAAFEVERLKKTAHWYTGKQETFEALLQEAKAKVKCCLLFKDEGGFWTYSGLTNYVSSTLRMPSTSNVQYPPTNLLAWDRKPNFEMYPYQQTALQKLLEAKHAGVSIGTGMGKSFIIANLLKALGLRAVVMAPSASITSQLYRDYCNLFGKKNVGLYGAGKKEVGKRITVATAQSLTRVEEGSKAWEFFSNSPVFIADESHQCPASTLAAVCFGLMKNSPYRFFFSATQMRGDGADMLLEAITGPIVFEKTVNEGIREGYLAKPTFRTYDVPPNGSYSSKDADRMSRHHLLYHPKVAEFVGRLCNTAHKAGMPCLVLIEEVEQFTRLLPYLRCPVGFAHGPLDPKGNAKKVPVEFHKSDPDGLVSDFNAGKLQLLVGTTCIGTGTDVKPVKMLVYWQGGKSEVQVRQAIGRGTRLSPGKTVFNVVDFRPMPPDLVDPKKWAPTRHAIARRRIYEDIGGSVLESVLP